MTPLLTVGDQQIPYTVRRSVKARHCRVRVTGKGVELVVPRRMSLAQATTFLEQNAEWVARQTAELHSVPRLAIVDKGTLLLRGSRVPFVIRTASVRNTVGLYPHPDGSVQLHLLPGTALAAAETLLETWLREQARAAVTERTAYWSPQLAVAPKQILIYGQKTRWGSCSTRGNITFNWRLILAPPTILDYVVIHELAHLREMNHSARFWDIVRLFHPDIVPARHWLRTEGSRLLAVPPGLNAADLP